MREKQKAIVWFDEVTREDVSTVGGKGANPDEMTRVYITVPADSVKGDYFWHIFR